MNCKICNEDALAGPAVPVSKLDPLDAGPGPVSVLPTIDGLKEQIPVVAPVPFRSEEGAAVLSVTDQYVKSCDEYAEAVTAVTNIELHIMRLEAMKLTLQHDVVEKKIRKEELRKKVLETISE